MIRIIAAFVAGIYAAQHYNIPSLLKLSEKAIKILEKLADE